MSTTTINQPAANQPAAPGNAPNQQRQPVTIALIREKLTTAPGKYILFLSQFLLSFVTLFYLRGIIQFAYNSIFYRLELTAGLEKTYCWQISITCFEFMLLMLFTRRQIVTRVVIMLAMPFYFPIFLFNYQHPQLVIPLHWDNFFSRLDRPITGMPRLVEKTEVSFFKLARHCESKGIHCLVQLPRTSVEI